MADDETKEPKEAKEPQARAKPAAGAGTPDKAAAPRRKRVRRQGSEGVAHVHATFNNTVVTITDPQGLVISWSSAGAVGFKGWRKGAPFAAQMAAEAAARKASDVGMRSVIVHIKGPGGGRESAVRSLQQAGLNVQSIKDVTPIPHNGCRPPKRRRV